MPKTERNVADYIVPLNMNGLEGRMLHIPAPKAYPKSEILIVYGHHSSLERWWGLAQNFNDYGAVTMPDLPGFGGMESLYTIGRQPTLDGMADYLASFVKWRYRRKKVSIVGLSFGFLVATRMLQRYPELTSKVNILVSAVGFSHYDDFVYSRRQLRVFRRVAKLLAKRPLPTIFRYTALDPWVLRLFYAKTFNAKKKFADVDKEEASRMMDMEVVLWHSNEVRTYWTTTYEMLTVDNCQKQINLPVWHIAAATDQYFHADLVEQHLRIIFTDFIPYINDNLRHAPSVVATAEESASFIPDNLRKAIKKQLRK